MVHSLLSESGSTNGGDINEPKFTVVDAAPVIIGR